MRNSIFAFAVIGLMAGALFIGCGKTEEQKVEKAQQEMKDAQAGYQTEWQTFKTESEQKIEANDKRIDTFMAKIEKAGPKAKAKYNKEVAELKQKNSELKNTLESYKDEGQDKWQEFKTNFNRDMDGIGKTMKDLFKDND